jgi:hypothetical protein
MDRVTALRRDGKTTAQIANALNREDFSTPRRCGALSSKIVNQLLMRRGLANEMKYTDALGPHACWLPNLADAIPVSAGKLGNQARRG